MKELEQILALWTQAASNGQSAVLVTVVKTHGSSYRLPGARLFLLSSGERAGSVSGGCLEADLLKKAWWLTERGPTIQRYDTTPDGEIAPAYGLGCSGIIHVLLERVTAENSGVLPLISDVRSQRRAAAAVHVIEPASAAGQQLTIDTSGRVLHNLPNAELALALEREADSALAGHTSHLAHLSGGVEAFVETLNPPVRLLVFGAGDDAIPLTKFAKLLGWNVVVLDGRAHYARREKFPEADDVITWPAGQTRFKLPIDSWTVAVLMTHSYSQDLDILQAVSSHPLAYVGILGPRKRASQLLTDADLDSPEFADALHSPMGLDIGADGPEQVALAVIAEIQATLNGREGGLLRERTGSIHARTGEEEDSAAAWVRSIACA
ncbi:MAG: XdhC family protein [Acidobacteriaceae bacterium]|nr:XdhC family protein [Acidobacteriaceae bacterium]